MLDKLKTRRELKENRQTTKGGEVWVGYPLYDIDGG